MTVRVIEYFTDVEGQDVPEMFCLVTDLLDWREYPARDLAALYKWRWDGSETALRETKSALRGAGPGTGPMLRPATPGMVRQELAAWAAATEMTRGVGRAAALAAVPARKGFRAGQPVQPREISFTAARRAVIAAVRHGRLLSYTALTSAIARCRTVTDRNRGRARKAKSPSTFLHADPGSTATRIAEAVITSEHARLTSQNTGTAPAAAPAGPGNRPSPGTTRRPSACPQPETTRRNQSKQMRAARLNHPNA